MAKKSITLEIPGGWYGNDPHPVEVWVTHPCLEFVKIYKGNVVVDPAFISPAIVWLKKRAYIEETWITDDPNPGICINYTLKRKRVNHANRKEQQNAM